MKVLLFGTGTIATSVMEKIDLSKTDIDIVGFVDNDETKYGKIFFGKPIYHPGQVKDIEFDYLCILLARGYKEVYNQLVYGYHVESNMIVNKNFLLKEIMINKYKKDERPFVQDSINYWRNNEISFMNQYQYESAHYDEVFWDDNNNMPYVQFCGKRLYYPRDYQHFVVKDDRLYAISYREAEQHELSPHRYLKGEIAIHKNDVVIDAGAQEGDFALSYIDIISKLYLFECDPSWVKALEMTYKDYADKVIIVPKMLSDKCSENTTTLQESINEDRIDFLKMDIEGSEVKALLSSQELLKKNNMRCAICTYHRKNDKKEIEQIFRENGYKCSFSNGYVVFIDDPNIFSDLDFRKAIMYASKC